MRAGTVFAIDALSSRLPLPLARILSVAMVLAALAFLGIVIQGSFALIERGEFQTSPTLQIPMWMIYAPFPFALPTWPWRRCCAPPTAGQPVQG